MIPHEIPELELYKKALRLRTTVAYAIDVQTSTVGVEFDFENGSCLVHIPPLILSDKALGLSVLVYILCRVKNSEIDPLFGVGIISDRYKNLSSEYRDQFESDMYLLGATATFLSKVWVCDVRHSHWPHMTYDDHKRYREFLEDAVKEGTLGQLMTYGHAFSFAQYLIEAHRYELVETQDFSFALDVLPLNVRAFIEYLVRVCQELPRLTGDKEHDIPLFQEWANTLIYMMDIDSIHPRIILEDGRLKWTLGAIYS
ncbi:MAG: hypothetical protein Q7R79_03560 [bacterium]|nr:hypothetical protein [bacterium]